MNQEEKKEVERIIENRVKETSSAVFSRSLTYIMAGLGFVAGLAWNDAIQTLIKTLFPLQTNGILAKFLYATVVTAVIVFISVRLEKKNP